MPDVKANVNVSNEVERSKETQRTSENISKPESISRTKNSSAFVLSESNYDEYEVTEGKKGEIQGTDTETLSTVSLQKVDSLRGVENDIEDELAERDSWSMSDFLNSLVDMKSDNVMLLGAIVVSIVALVLCFCVCKRFVARCCCCANAKKTPDSRTQNSNVNSGINRRKGRYGYGRVNESERGNTIASQTIESGVEMTSRKEYSSPRNIRTDSDYENMSLLKLAERSQTAFASSMNIVAKDFESAWSSSENIDDVWGITLKELPRESFVIKHFRTYNIHCIASGLVKDVCKFYFCSSGSAEALYMCEVTISADNLRAACVFKQSVSGSSTIYQEGSLFRATIKKTLSEL